MEHDFQPGGPKPYSGADRGQDIAWHFAKCRFRMKNFTRRKLLRPQGLGGISGGGAARGDEAGE